MENSVTLETEPFPPNSTLHSCFSIQNPVLLEEENAWLGCCLLLIS